MSLDVGYLIETLSEEDAAKFAEIADVYNEGAVKILPEGLIFPARYQPLDELYRSFKSRKGDVMVIGYPRSGTTWMQEIVWNMTNDPNLEDTRTQEIYSKSPMFEVDVLGKPTQIFTDSNFIKELRKLLPSVRFGEDDFKMFDILDHTPDRRVIKSHLYPSFFNPQLMKTAKIIYIIRNPKDVTYSFYHLHIILSCLSFKGTLEEFVEAHMAGKVLYGDYPSHIRQWWPYRDAENVHFVYYEEMKSNPMEELKKMDKFLETNLTETQLEQIKEAVSFENMKKKKSMLNANADRPSEMFNADAVKESGAFYRKGTTGTGNIELRPELKQKLDAFLIDRLKGIPLPREYFENE